MPKQEKEKEHFEFKHKGKEDGEKGNCDLCKAYVDGLSVAPAADLGVDVSLKVPLVDVFGKVN